MTCRSPLRPCRDSFSLLPWSHLCEGLHRSPNRHCHELAMHQPTIRQVVLNILQPVGLFPSSGNLRTRVVSQTQWIRGQNRLNKESWARSPVLSRGYVNCPSIYGILERCSPGTDTTPSPRDSTMPEPTRERETGRPPLPALTAGPLTVRTVTPRVEASTSSGRANPAERRNVASRQLLLRRIVVEYDEMPGLCLTAPAGTMPVRLTRRHLHAGVRRTRERRDSSTGRQRGLSAERWQAV